MTFDTLTAADLMTAKVRTIDPSATLREAAEQMNLNHIQCLLIPAPAANRSVGILTCKDIVQLLADSDPEMLREVRVDEAMTAPAMTVRSDLCIIDCLKLMCMSGIRTVPVMDGVQPVGILSFAEILRASLETA